MKKIIALLLTLVMLVSAMSTMAFAEEAEEAAPVADAVAEEVVSGTADAELYASLKEEVGLVKTLGIMSNINEYNIKEEIPRGKFVEHILNLMGLTAAKQDGAQQYFADVPAGSTYYDTITTAAMVGFVQGTGTGYFSPDRTITYNEAIKLIVAALDYNAVAMARGGYPTGYNAVANDLKLTKGISLGYGEPLTNADAVKLIYNALNANAADMNISSDSSVSMSSKDILVLEDKFNVEKFKGVVTGTQVTRQLEGKDYVGWVEIDNVEYEVIASEYFNEEDLLGMMVYYYVKYDEEVTGDTRDGKIIMISPMPERNTVIDVVDEDIQPSTSVSVFRYWDKNEKSVEKNIANATIYYNGRNCAGYLEADGSDLRPQLGNVRLIDNNRDGKIDVVIIESYTEYIVEYGATKKIVTKYGGEEINLENSDDIIMVRDGVVITADYLGEWESLKVMWAKNGGCYIKVSGDEISGVIENINDEEIKIAGVVYEYSDVYKNALEEGHYQAETDKKGSTVTIALNEDNKVVGMKATVNDVTEYGYLVKAVDEGGLDSKSYVKIYCMYGAMNIFECAENIKINGRKISGTVGSVFNLNNGKTKDQLIKYTRKGDLVTAIYTADDATFGQERVYGAADNTKFTLNYQRKNSSWNFTSGRSLLEDKYVITTTFIPTFWIPRDLTQESLFNFYETSSSINGLAKNTELYVYDATLLEPNYEIYTPAVLVVKDNTIREEISPSNPYILSSVSSGQTYHVVDSVEATVDGAGNDTFQITSTVGTVIGFETTVYNADTTNLYGYGEYDLGMLEKGDIIQVAYGNDDQKANRFVVIAVAEDYASDNTEYKWWSNDRSNNVADIYEAPGYNDSILIGEIIYENHPTYIVRTKNKEGGDEFVFLNYNLTYPTSSGIIYVYERGSKNAYKATSNQLAPGKRCLMQIKNNGYMGSFIVMITD